MIYSSWDMIYSSWVWQAEIGNYLSFLALLPPSSKKPHWKITILKKWKKIAENIIILHMCNKNHNHMKYGSLRYRVRQTKVFVTLSHFLLFYLPNNLENQNFENLKKTPGWQKPQPHITHLWQKPQSYEVRLDKSFCHFEPFFAILPTSQPGKSKFRKNKKIKKTSGDVIVLHMCTKNKNHVTYASWDMKLDRQNFLSIWNIFCCFAPLTIWKTKIFKKWKKSLKILFYTCVA